ncbi:MAG TPA: hypothetical protein PKL73_19450 [Polyangiaceae bacterium]|jgi:hypothetical protein|nr:hypothetical protein [Polyangiaceae bacterium]HNZ24961.1 hypothetical protein [Polyangiaceae bacterium]HOD24081.1 hypothetical protein [Polyangiaceae bacterium]HOE50316.1 hypothetical protein [Polyangiaceae bacterium]HOH02782.1 hypothetical protein [Polyangiaceae bacterium]
MAMNRHWLLGLGVMIGVGACQLVVGETGLGTVRCQDEGAMGPPACAKGQTCVKGTCVVAVNIGHDGGETGASGGTGGAAGSGGAIIDSGADVSGSGGVQTGGSGGAGGETGGVGGTGGTGTTGGTGGAAGTAGSGGTEVDSGNPLKSLGEPCGHHQECKADLFCAARFGMLYSVCTRHCCSQEDCDLFSATCQPTNFGTTACFKAEPAEITDPCCNHMSNCGTQTCAWSKNHWQCMDRSGKKNGEGCDNDEQCLSGICSSSLTGLAKRCMAPCCNDDNCDGFDFCANVESQGQVRRQCVPFEVLVRLGGFDDRTPACCSDGDCSPGRCVPVSQQVLYRQSTPFGPKVSKKTAVAMGCE